MIDGIDMSERQMEIDWKKVAADGVQFVMLRAVYGVKRDSASSKTSAVRSTPALLSASTAALMRPRRRARTGRRHFCSKPLIRTWRISPTLSPSTPSRTGSTGSAGGARSRELILTYSGKVEEAGYIPMTYTNCS